MHPGASGSKRVHPRKLVCARTQELLSGGRQGLQPLNLFIILKRVEDEVNEDVVLELYTRVLLIDFCVNAITVHPHAGI